MKVAEKIFSEKIQKYATEYLNSKEGENELRKFAKYAVKEVLQDCDIDFILGTNGSRKFYDAIEKAAKKRFGIDY